MLPVAVVAAVVAVAALVALAAAHRARRDAERSRDEASDAAAAAAERAEHAEQEREGAIAAASDARDLAERAAVAVARLETLVHALWALELVRVARTWVIAAGGAAPPGSVAVDTAEELRVALGMELDQLREEAGIPGDLVASPPPGEVSIATALLSLRLQQELLAAVARASDGLTLGVSTAGGELVLTTELDAAEAAAPEVLVRIAETTGAAVEVDGSVLRLRVKPF